VSARPTSSGPVQLLVIAFADGHFDGGILAELRRLRDAEAVRLLDLLFVAKDAGGEVAELEIDDLSVEERVAYGALVRELFGTSAAAPNGSSPGQSETWFLADLVPAGTAAAVVLLEHRWATRLREAVEAAAGHDLVDTWVHPRDLAPQKY
jgi:Family of unknown function (DUF6325)